MACVKLPLILRRLSVFRQVDNTRQMTTPDPNLSASMKLREVRLARHSARYSLGQLGLGRSHGRIVNSVKDGRSARNLDGRWPGFTDLSKSRHVLVTNQLG